MKQSGLCCLIYHSLRGTEYLAGFETCCFGTRALGYYDKRRSCALPLLREQAEQLLALFDYDERKRLNIISYPRHGLVDMVEDLEKEGLPLPPL